MVDATSHEPRATVRGPGLSGHVMVAADVSDLGLHNIAAGVLLMAYGGAALGFWTLTRSRRERAVAWFGVFTGLYGLRLLAGAPVLPLVTGLPERVWWHLEAGITYTILAPVALIITSVIGDGWRRTLRWTWMAAVVYAVVGVGLDVASATPGHAIWLNPPMVTLASVAGLGNIVYASWGQRWTPAVRRVAGAGLFLLAGALVATFDTGTVHGDLVELTALFVFIGTVTAWLASRVVDNERRLTAVTRELELARGIQRSLLPRTMPQVPGLRVAAAYIPTGEVAGDLYDFAVHRETALGVLIADVSGHGVPAAIIASMVKVAFAAAANDLDRPGLVLERMHRTLEGTFERAFITACCVVIDPQAGEVCYAAAGHHPPQIWRAGEPLPALPRGGPAIPFTRQPAYVSHRAALHSGDRLLLVTDGLLEAENEAGEFFGERRLADVMRSRRDDPPNDLVVQIVDALRSWRGDRPLADDVTVVVVDRP